MTVKEKIDKILSISALKLKDKNDLAIKSGVLPNTLTVAINRNTLSDDIIMKIHDKLKVRREFLKEGREPVLIEENGTLVQNGAAVKQNTIDLGEAIRLIVEGSEYYLIPKVAIEGKYRLMPLEEISIKEKELERKSLDLIRKDDQILGLQELVKLIASKVPDAPIIKEAQKNTGV